MQPSAIDDPAAQAPDAAASIAMRNAALTPGHLRLMLLVVSLPVLGTAWAAVELVRHGVSNLNLALLAVLYVLTGLGIEFGYHRTLSHRALRTGVALETLFAVLGAMAGQGRLLYWVANHRRHHIYSDTVDDPHSPHVRRGPHGEEKLGMLGGLWHAHVGWVFSDELTNCGLFARDILKKRHLMLVDRLFLPITALGLLIPGAIAGAVTGAWQGAFDGMLWGGLVRIFLINQATWSVASLCHCLGARPYDTGDRSGNIFIVALFSFGAGWQNNHHAFPTSATTSLHWWQVDVTKWFIDLLQWCHLVTDVRLPGDAPPRRRN